MAYKIGAFQTSATPLSITGLGFKPTYLLTLGASLSSQDSTAIGLTVHVNSAKESASIGDRIGYNYSTNRNTFTNVHLGGGLVRANEAVTEFERLINGNQDTVNIYNLTSFDADGFTIAGTTFVNTWQYYLAIDANVTVSDTQSQNWPTSNGVQSIGGMSERPTLALFFHTGVSGGNFGMGWSDGTNDGCVTLQNRHNVTTGSVHKFQSAEHCIATLNNTTGALEGLATCAFTDTGLDLTWDDAPPSADNFRVVMFSGMTAKVGSFLLPTAASTDIVGTVGLNPEAVLFMSYGDIANPFTSSAGARLSLGLSNGSSFNRSIWNGDENGTTNDGSRRNLRRMSSTKALRLANPASNTADTMVAEFTADTFTNGSFDVDWSTADATQREVLFLAFGDDVSEGGGGGIPVYEVRIGDETGLNPILETFRIQETLDAPDTCIMDLETIGEPFQRFSLGDPVYVTENGVRIFGGYVTGLRERGLSGPNGTDLVVEVQATSYEINAQRRVITKSFSEGSPQQSLIDVLTELVDEYYADVGVSLHPDQADGPEVPTLEFERVRGDQVNRQIAESIGYLTSIDFENRLRMWQPGDISAPYEYDEDVNPEILTGDIDVEKQLQNGYANRVVLVGEPLAVPDHVDEFTGDGSNDTFAITYKVGGPYPYFVDGAVAFGVVRYPATGTTESIGGVGAPLGFIWEYDPIAQTIRRRSGVVANGVDFEFPYHGLFIPNATAQDAAEILQFGLWEHVEVVTAVPDDASAQEYADALLAQKLASKEQIVTLRTRALGFHPGQTIPITSPLRELSDDYLITQVDTAAEAGSPILLKTITAAKSETNDHDWRKVLQRWSNGSSSSSSSAGAGTSSTTSQIGSGTGIHHANHENGGIDEIKLDDLGEPDDNTDLDVSSTAHGLVPKIDGSDGDVLTIDSGVAVWAPQTGASGSPSGPDSGEELAYVQFTSPVTISATTEGTANTIVSSGSVSYDGSTVVLVEFYALCSQPAASAGSNIIFYLYQDGSSLGQIGQHQNPASATNRVPCNLKRRLTPSSGSHTYDIRAARGVGDGTVRAGAGGSGNEMPGFIRITVV